MILFSLIHYCRMRPREGTRQEEEGEGATGAILHGMGSVARVRPRPASKDRIRESPEKVSLSPIWPLPVLSAVRTDPPPPTSSPCPRGMVLTKHTFMEFLLNKKKVGIATQVGECFCLSWRRASVRWRKRGGYDDEGANRSGKLTMFSHLDWDRRHIFQSDFPGDFRPRHRSTVKGGEGKWIESDPTFYFPPFSGLDEPTAGAECGSN